MPLATPITRQTVGRTFTVAISILGAGALMQLAAVCWAFIARFHTPPAVLVADRPEASASTDIPTLARLAPITPAADFSDPLAEGAADSLAMPPLSDASPTTAPSEPVPAATPPPKPTPIAATQPSKMLDPTAAERFAELLEQGKMLRERGDTGAALTKFREAQALDARSPRAIAEIGMTYEKMGLTDRANEQWKRIYDLGETAGVLYAAAEAKLKAAQASELSRVMSQNPSGPDDAGGIARGATLGLLDLKTEEMQDPQTSRKFMLHVPIKARFGARIDANDLVIQVHFYDVVDASRVERTAADVSSRWGSVPPDWADSDTEELLVQYALPVEKRNRKYFGYLVRLYYKGALQAATGIPETLVQKFPPPPTLPTESSK